MEIGVIRSELESQEIGYLKLELLEVHREGVIDIYNDQF